MNSVERTATLSLSGLFAARLIGLFMVLPVLSLYANGLTGATPTLIGLALGGYGLTQALFQIPCGMLSDRYHRKWIMAYGLVVFILGSLVCALSSSIYQMIIGRILQGAGAIGGVTMALLTDLTREEHRTKAMAGIGITIGASFLLAMMLGPMLSQWVGVAGLFWISAGLGLFSIYILIQYVPSLPPTLPPASAYQTLNYQNLMPLNLGVMILHTILTANFVVLPLILQQRHYIYFPVLLTACLIILPILKLARQKEYVMRLTLFMVLLLTLSLILLYFTYSYITGLIIGLTLFFIAFTFLEASLPACISYLVPAHQKGTAMGIYSCSQFLGMFFGGVSGGWLYGHYEISSVFIFCVMLSFLWLILMRYFHHGQRHQ